MISEDLNKLLEAVVAELFAERAKVRELEAELKTLRIAELRRRMASWSETWYFAGWLGDLSRRIWNGTEEEAVAYAEAASIVAYGKHIGYWIPDYEAEAVTIEEWERML